MQPGIRPGTPWPIRREAFAAGEARVRLTPQRRKTTADRFHRWATAEPPAAVRYGYRDPTSTSRSNYARRCWEAELPSPSHLTRLTANRLSRGYLAISFSRRSNGSRKSTIVVSETAREATPPARLDLALAHRSGRRRLHRAASSWAPREATPVERLPLAMQVAWRERCQGG